MLLQMQKWLYVVANDSYRVIESMRPHRMIAKFTIENENFHWNVA